MMPHLMPALLNRIPIVYGKQDTATDSSVTNRPKILDIARVAGLSPATVDRVLNKRPGVSRKSVKLVLAAEEQLLGAARSPEPLNGAYDVILPRDAGLSTEYLIAAFKFHAEKRGVRVRITQVERLNAQSLAAALYRCNDEGTAGIAFQALEDPAVYEAVENLRAAGIPLLTIVSGLSGMGLGYIGLDNRSAGRTAGYLMALCCGGAGRVAVIWGGHLYRGHDEREFGFRSFLRTTHPSMELIDVTCTQDDAVEAYERLQALLDSTVDLKGTYCVGGGILGVVQALKERRCNARCFVIGHNLTANTRECLIERSAEAIIHQDMTAIADRAFEYFLSENKYRDEVYKEIPIQIVTRENISTHLSIDDIKRYL